MKNFTLGALVVLLIGAIGIIVYQQNELNTANDMLALHEEFGEVVLDSDGDEYYEGDYEDYEVDGGIVEMNDEFYRIIDVYPDHSIPTLLDHFLSDVLYLGDEEGVYYYDNTYMPLKSNYYDFASYYQWYFEYPEYLDYETVYSESMGFFWGDYLWSFDRSADNIESMFSKHSDVLYSLIDRDLYYSSDLNEYVDVLINVKDDLENYYDYEEEFEAIYNENVDYLWLDNFYSVLNDDIVSDWYRNDEYYEENEVFWIYSFWYRRWIEGNEDAVYRSLKQVQKHYQ